MYVCMLTTPAEPYLISELAEKPEGYSGNASNF